MPTRYGEFTAYAYRSLVDDNPYLALVYGEVADGRGHLGAHALGLPDRRRARLAAVRLR